MKYIYICFFSKSTPILKHCRCTIPAPVGQPTSRKRIKKKKQSGQIYPLTSRVSYRCPIKTQRLEWANHQSTYLTLLWRSLFLISGFKENRCAKRQTSLEASELSLRRITCACINRTPLSRVPQGCDGALYISNFFYSRDAPAAIGFFIDGPDSSPTPLPDRATVDGTRPSSPTCRPCAAVFVT